MAALPRLEIVAEIARGGQARLFLTRVLGECPEYLLALKEIGSPAVYELESCVLAKLDHPGICRLLGRTCSAAKLGLLTEYVPGANLATMLSILHERAKQLSLEAIYGLAEDILAAMAHLEARGVVHGDLAAENILVSRDGRIKLCDFGAARIMGDLRPGLGTFGRKDFLAPEVLSGEIITSWSDLYALGAVLFELVVGARFRAESPGLSLALLRVKLSIPQTGLYYIIRSCLASLAWQRPPSAAQLSLRLRPMGAMQKQRAERELGMWAQRAMCLIPMRERKFVDFAPTEFF